MARFQRGWLRVENRKQGPIWVLRYKVTRESDGKRVEHTRAIGLVRDFPGESAAWAEVERQHLHLNEPEPRGRVTFADLAEHYIQYELGEQSDATNPKSHTTVGGYRRILRNRLVPRWGKRIALSIEPVEVENWLKSVKREEDLQNPTLDKIRRVMALVYKSGQRYGLIPRRQECNPLHFVRCKTTSSYEAMIITPAQAFAVLMNLPDPERTLTLLAAATGLRISECLGLQWWDVDFVNQRIQVRRTWTVGRVGLPKSHASQAPVPMAPLLAEFMQGWQRQTLYSQPTDWVFASRKLEGKQPRVANMLVKDYLRPAAVNAGILTERDPRRFGFHNLRHSLASFLVHSKCDVKTVQALLRHSDVKTTLQLYAHSTSADRLAAQDEVLVAILKSDLRAAVN